MLPVALIKRLPRALALVLLATMLGNCAGASSCLSSALSPRALPSSSPMPRCHARQHSSEASHPQSSGHESSSHDCCSHRHPASALLEGAFPRPPLMAAAAVQPEGYFFSFDRKASRTCGNILSAVSPPPLTSLRI
jgi:hypothetical protein